VIPLISLGFYSHLAADTRLSPPRTLISQEPSIGAPLILGTRLARLSEASTALGGSARGTMVEKVSTTDPCEFRNYVASRVGRLYSNFDIFGLVISMGNYPSLREGSF
jgi:hypothetical protein